MKLDVVIADVDVTGIAGKRTVDVLGVTGDSRRVRPGHLFVAIPGHREDGAAYVEDALARGAAAVVTEAGLERWARHAAGPGRERPVCLIQVANARLALAHVAARFFGFPARSLCMVGVTGTNGKTTTATLIREILKAAGWSAGLFTTIRYAIGERSIPAVRTTPAAPDIHRMLREIYSAGCTAAVMEVSSHALEQKRVAGIDFDVAAFTNLTRDHLDYHGTMEHYFDAKRILFLEQVDAVKGVCVINVDDPWGRRLARTGEVRGRVLTFGTRAGADVRAERIELRPAETRFDVVTPWGDCAMRSKLLGRFNISNALAALGVCGTLGIAPAEAAATLATMQRVAGRLEEVPNDRGVHIFVDYAHTDDALHNVLTTLRELATRRLIVVFGCGGDRDSSKRPAMARVAEKVADVSVVTSDNPRSETPANILHDIVAGFERSASHEVIEDRGAAIRHAVQIAESGDVVLIAGKGHEKFQEFAHTTIPFDDVLVAREAVGEGESIARPGT